MEIQQRTETPTILLGPVRHLAYYSDIAGVVRFDLSGLKTFTEPKVPADLNYGKAACIRRNKKNTTLGHPIPLDRMLEACAALGASSVLKTAHVVTWRGIINKLMLGYGPLHLHVSMVDEILYILEVDPSPMKVHIGQLASSYYGYAFEALCTAPEQGKPLHVDMDVWKCIVSRTLGDLNLVFGAEVDCIRGEYTGNSSTLMELKTVQQGASGSSKNRHKWYLQSHLIDIPEIVVGYRDQNSVLRETKSFPTEHFSPGKNALMADYMRAYTTIQVLRESCTSYPMQDDIDRNDAIWKATVRNSTVQEFRLLDATQVAQVRRHVKGKRLGLLPADYVTQLRATR